MEVVHSDQVLSGLDLIRDQGDVTAIALPLSPERLLVALRNAGIDRAAFEAALATLKADKSVKSAAVAEIARRYADTVTKYKSIAAAHADIASAFTQRARFASKVG